MKLLKLSLSTGRSWPKISLFESAIPKVFNVALLSVPLGQFHWGSSTGGLKFFKISVSKYKSLQSETESLKSFYIICKTFQIKIPKTLTKML
jgi:hypothetical protein